MDITKTAVWLATALCAFFLSERLGKWLIPLLHRLKFGQTIREEGPAWHQKKSGTPTMGGVIFIAAILVVSVLSMAVCQLFLPLKPVAADDGVADITRLFAGILMAVGFGVIGFLDDFIKVVKKRNLGLTSRQKLIAQLLVSSAYAVALYLADATRIHVPFIGFWDAGIWFIPITVFVLVAMTNATNLTDGVDGLCATVTLAATLFFLMLCHSFAGFSVFASATAGALAGFLVWNLHPAKVFMGDTGSLFLGGVLCAIAFGIGRPFLLVPFGVVYVAETVSVVLQVGYFKLTHGKRLFKMSPLHHHFEMCGWSENKIVTVFTVVTVVGCILGTLLLI